MSSMSQNHVSASRCAVLGLRVYSLTLLRRQLNKVQRRLNTFEFSSHPAFLTRDVYQPEPASGTVVGKTPQAGKVPVRYRPLAQEAGMVFRYHTSHVPVVYCFLSVFPALRAGIGDVWRGVAAPITRLHPIYRNLPCCVPSQKASMRQLCIAQK